MSKKSDKIMHLEFEVGWKEHEINLLKGQIKELTRPFDKIEVLNFYGHGIITKDEARRLIGIDK